MAISPSDKRLKSYATAIGYVCINWTWLEQIVDVALSYFMNQQISSVEMECVVVNADIHDKLKMLKALAQLRKPDDDWFDRMDTLINKISQNIAPRRNRVVHDRWTPGHSDAAMRTYARTAIVKPQSHQPKKLTTHQTFSMKVTDINAVSKDITLATHALFVLMRDVPGFTAAMAS